jgi:hypothetical protein
MDMDARWFRARGINPLTAGEILAKVRDERKLWERVLDSDDDRVLLQALMFLVSMRDGKPAQSINVASTVLHLGPGDIDKARAIVAEIRGDHSPSLSRSVDSDYDDISHSGLVSQSEGSDPGVDTSDNSDQSSITLEGNSNQVVKGETRASIMLETDEGGQKVVR